MQNGIARPGKRFEEFARVLRREGRLILLGMHPCFYAARAERDAVGSADGFTVDTYFGTRVVQQHFNVAGLGCKR